MMVPTESLASRRISRGQQSATNHRPQLNRKLATQRRRAGRVREVIRSGLASDVLVGKAGEQEYYFTLFARAPTRPTPRGTSWEAVVA